MPGFFLDHAVEVIKIGEVINLECAWKQKHRDPYGILASIEESARRETEKLIEHLTGRPCRVADYIANHAAEWAAEGARLQALRERAGMSRTALAKTLEVSPQRIARLEQGMLVVDARLLRAAYLLFLENLVERRR